MRNGKYTCAAMALAALVALPLWAPTSAWAQVVVEEDFEGASGAGGGEFFLGKGWLGIDDWDTGLTGENAYAGTQNRAYARASVEAVAGAGVDSGVAGVLSISDVSFNPLHEDFENVSGNMGGGVYMDSLSGSEGYTPNWDNNIDGEAAFGGVVDGAALQGTMSAQALPGLGYAELDVDDVDVTTGFWYAGVFFTAPALEGAVVLGNVGFDDEATIEPWVTWNNAFAETPMGDPDHPFTPRSGGQSLKMYGPFLGAYGTSGAYQDLPAVPGQTWELDGYAQQLAADTIDGTLNWVEMLIEFRDAADNVIGTNGVSILASGSPTDVWIDAPAVQAVAPANTVVARALFVFHQPGVGIYEGGAALIDDARFEVVAGPAQSAVDLASISLTADVQGLVDAAGETLGDYQLRLEDNNGNRLAFMGTADGNWQSIGGPLSTAVEMDSNGAPVSGMFNTAASSYTVVVTFDNDTSLTWGTGGTLNIDNVILSGSDTTDSDWNAGMFWNELVMPTGDMSELTLTADIMGDVVGGMYDLRVEGYVINSNGVNEEFTDATAAGVQTIVTYDMTTAGVTSGWTDNWDYGLVGEAAFGGLDTGSLFCSGSQCPGLLDVGISAKGLTTGGNPGACGQIKMTGLWQLAPGGDWWGGVMWLNQALASDNLSQVELNADVKGYADTLWGEQLGSIEIRIEDEDGDRLYKQYNATAAWQTIGGTLDTFTEGAPASGSGGSGAFDTDDLNYTVVIAFNEPFTTWTWGGTILVDNVFITPADVEVELGRVRFVGTADGTFQSIGGALDTGVSTFVTDLEEDMESAAGDSLQFWPGDWGNADYDSGLVDDAYFGGTWGAGTLGAVTAQTCLTCGYDGSAAAQLVVENPGNVTGGGWWAGLAWNDQRLEIADLSTIIMTAKIKGEPDAGGQYGTISLKLEDPNLDALEFLVIPDGTWQTVGGPLSTATEIASGNTAQGSDGVFDVNAPSYKLIVSTWGPTATGTPGVDPDWTSSHTVTVDDVFLTRPGYSFADAEAYTATVAFTDPLATWGTAGTLTVDNLNLQAGPVQPECAAHDVDCNGSTNAGDILVVRSGLNWNQTAGAAADPRCDVDGNGVCNAGDILVIRSGLNWNTSTGPCVCP